MTAPPVYLDECVDVALADALRPRGLSVTIARDHGPIGASGEEQLTYAASLGWAILSQELVYDPAERRREEYATLILNGPTIEVAGGLDAPLKASDELLLPPGFSGVSRRSTVWPSIEGSQETRPAESSDCVRWMSTKSGMAPSYEVVRAFGYRPTRLR